MGRADRLNALDAAFLQAERHGVRPHVGALTILDPSTRRDGPLSVEVVRQLVAGRLHLLPRLRQRLRFVPYGAGRPVWVDDDSFDVSAHLHHTVVPRRSARAQLGEAVGCVLTTPFDRSRPLWDLHLLEGLDEGRVALFLRWHHALGDGLSGVQIARVLFDRSPGHRPSEPEPWGPARPPSARELVVESIADQLEKQLQAVSAAGTEPRRSLARAATVVEGFLSYLAAGPVPASPFNVAVSSRWRYSMLEVPLGEVEQVRRAVGVTVHDVVLAAVAGALSRLLDGGRTLGPGQTLRTVVPTRKPGQSRRGPGNEASLFLLDLPVGPMADVARLRRISAAVEELKRSGHARTAAMLMGVANQTPPLVGALLTRLAARGDHANLIVSYLSGPRGSLYLAGARHLATYPVLPLTPRLALMVGALRMGDVIGVGVTADGDVGDLDGLDEALRASFDRLRGAVGDPARSRGAEGRRG